MLTFWRVDDLRPRQSFRDRGSLGDESSVGVYIILFTLCVHMGQSETSRHFSVAWFITSDFEIKMNMEWEFEHTDSFWPGLCEVI